MMPTQMPPTLLDVKREESSLFPIIEPHLFSQVVNKMRLFFLNKGYVEVHTQNRLSIMAACEDPSTIASYNYHGEVWPLPQTGQMWLEFELLDKPKTPGFFCLSTSYRNEPNPVEGRHCTIFPMFEFELPGGMDELIKVEAELLEYLGFGKADSFPQGDYDDVAKEYNVTEIDKAEETQIGKDYGPVFFLNNFPENTNPFWNMKRHEDNPSISKKVDVLLHGMETIGSAERSCNTKEMKDTFYTIENGKYAEKLFDMFGKERVEKELEEFLNHEFMPRSGGGIGVTRMIRAMQLSNLV
jgi:aspartyl/asparaginyl-tRNA synthetase